MTDVPKEKRGRRWHGTGCLWEATIQAGRQPVIFSFTRNYCKGCHPPGFKSVKHNKKKRNKNKNSNNFLRWKKLSSFLSNTRSDSLNSTEWHLWLTPSRLAHTVAWHQLIMNVRLTALFRENIIITPGATRLHVIAYVPTPHSNDRWLTSPFFFSPFLFFPARRGCISALSSRNFPRFDVT